MFSVVIFLKYSCVVSSLVVSRGSENIKRNIVSLELHNVQFTFTMSDSSEEEDLSRFKDSIDPTFVKLIDRSRGITVKESDFAGCKKSERYLETSTHYNDIRVPEAMQKKIGAKISAIIGRNIEFVDLENKVKKRKIKGGVKLFTDSENFLSHEEPKDTLTEIHNVKSKKLRNQRRENECDNEINNEDKVKLASVSGEYVLSKEETKCWKSRRKEKLFKYKSNGKSKVLTAVE